MVTKSFLTLFIVSRETINLFSQAFHVKHFKNIFIILKIIDNFVI